jgi:hypothetical protein
MVRLAVGRLVRSLARCSIGQFRLPEGSPYESEDADDDSREWRRNSGPGGGARGEEVAMFAEGTYVDESGMLRDADGKETGFGVEDDGRIISTDGISDAGGAYIDDTGQVFYGDDTPMQGVVVTIGEWPGATSGQLQTTALLGQYTGEDETAAQFDPETKRGKLPQDSDQWTTSYDAAETDSVRPRSIEGGLLVDETGSPMDGTYGYVLAPNGQLWTFAVNEMWIQQGDEWIDLGLLDDQQLAIAAFKAAVDLGVSVQTVHHSTAVAGGPVAGAGILKVKAGQIVEIDDTSGHYKPQAEYLVQTAEWLQKQGVKIDDIVLKDIAQQKAAEEIRKEWVAKNPPVSGGYVGS